MIYDYLIIGAGLFGSIFAYEANKIGKKVLVIDQRNHIGGNCYTEPHEDYHIHKYGPHIFHTSKKYIWDYLNEFTEFNNYSHRVKAINKGKTYSLPVNLSTINQIWPEVNTPDKAIAKIQSEIVPCENPKNLEEHILSFVGPTIYETLIYGYTKKQWGKEPKYLPSSIIKRLPIRYTYDDSYYPDQDIYQGIPVNGYTPIFEKMLKGIDIELNVDFFSDRSYWESKAHKIVYTGQIQRYFDYMYGDLEYRSLDFKNYEVMTDFQGCSQMNYPDENTSWNRIIQHKHFTKSKSKYDLITYEYSKKYDSKDLTSQPYYAVNDETNNLIYERYKDYYQKFTKNLIIGGRLGNYRYYDMDMTIANALSVCKRELAGISV